MIEKILLRMLEAALMSQMHSELYYYSSTYQEDCDALREWLKENNIKQTFMLYGDALVGGKLVLKDDPNYHDIVTK